MLPINVVLDTNVLVSALLSQGIPARIIQMLSARMLRPCYSPSILAEYWTVLSRPKFSFSPEKINILINGIIQRGLIIMPAKSKTVFADESDRKFYDTAVNTKSILITGNIKHFPKQNFVMTPTEFIKNYN